MTKAQILQQARSVLPAQTRMSAAEAGVGDHHLIGGGAAEAEHRVRLPQGEGPVLRNHQLQSRHGVSLGAGQASVVWMVLRETLTLAAIGVPIGLAGAYAATRLIQAQLFGVTPTDLLTMAAASLGIAAVTALAGYIPARQATAIDPMTALRWE